VNPADIAAAEVAAAVATALEVRAADLVRTLRRARLAEHRVRAELAEDPEVVAIVHAELARLAEGDDV